MRTPILNFRVYNSYLCQIFCRNTVIKTEQQEKQNETKKQQTNKQSKTKSKTKLSNNNRAKPNKTKRKQ